MMASILKTSLLVILGLTCVFCDQEPVHVDLWATTESQNLTSPDLEGNTGFRIYTWGIHVSTSETSARIALGYLNLPDAENCAETYLEIFDVVGNYTIGRWCGQATIKEVWGTGGLLIKYRARPEVEEQGFSLQYTAGAAEVIICYGPRKSFKFVICITSTLLFIVAVVAIVCVRKKCVKRSMIDKKPVTDFINGEKPIQVLAGPPSYDDVTKEAQQPPPYSSVAVA